MGIGSLVVFYSLVLVSFGEVAEYKMSPEECKAAGFVPESLQCSSCERLSDFNLETLITDCNSCCIKERALEHEKFALAHIEVCECNLSRFPQVQAFVHNDMASAWGGRVKVKHVRGVRPQIVLKDHTGSNRQTLNIEKWDTDTITEFLNQWIE